MRPAAVIASCLGLAMLVSVYPLPAAEVQETAQKSPSITIRMAGGWRIIETPNFCCWCQLPEDEAIQLAESCEVWRKRLRTTWNPHAERLHWTPKCEIYIHPSREAYNTTLRRPGDSSVGSTILSFDQGITVARRIDVRADASDWSNAALPHELTHVVLGERFGGRPLPRWADEGIAMLSESTDKHRNRLENLQKLLSANVTCSIADVLSYRRLPVPHLRDAYYGQSLALTSLLIHKSTPAQFADFLEDSGTTGIEAALQSHYGIQDIEELQQLWNGWAREPSKIKFVSLSIQVGHAADVASAVP